MDFKLQPRRRGVPRRGARVPRREPARGREHERLRVHRRVEPQGAREALGRLLVAEGSRRRRRRDHRAGDPEGGDGEAERAAARHLLHGPGLGRPVDHPVRHRSAEAALHPRHPRRQVPVVHRLLRARRRQRPRGAPVQGRARRRRLRRERPEDLDLDRDVVEVDHPAGAHRLRTRSRSTTASPACWSRWRRPGIEVRPIKNMSGTRCSPRCSSTTCACRSRTGSAPRARAGR